MSCFELRKRMVSPEFGNGIKAVPEFFLLEFSWDSMEGKFVENIFSSNDVIYDIKHLRNYIIKYKAVIYSPQSDKTYSVDCLPKNKNLKFV